MSNEDILSQFNSLPPDGQRQVLDFIASLHQRYNSSQGIGQQPPLELAEEGFIGMWRDRADLEDSTAWVRSNREREWVKQGD
jgi:hypothetical protein